MPDQRNGRPVVSGNTLILAIAAMFVALVAGVVILAVGLPESQNPAALVGQLLGSFATLVVALGALFKISQVEHHTNELVNGLMDSKVRVGVADVLDDDLIDPDAQEQLAHDRARRTAAHEETN